MNAAASTSPPGWVEGPEVIASNAGEFTVSDRTDAASCSRIDLAVFCCAEAAGPLCALSGAFQPAESNSPSAGTRAAHRRTRISYPTATAQRKLPLSPVKSWPTTRPFRTYASSPAAASYNRPTRSYAVAQDADRQKSPDPSAHGAAVAVAFPSTKLSSVPEVGWNSRRSESWPWPFTSGRHNPIINWLIPCGR